MHQVITHDDFDVSGKKNLLAEEKRRRIVQCTEGRESHEVAAWPKPERDVLLRRLKEKECLSIRQSERATEISRGVATKC